MGNMQDRLLVEVRVDFSRTEIVTESEIRIKKRRISVDSLLKRVF